MAAPGQDEDQDQDAIGERQILNQTLEEDQDQNAIGRRQVIHRTFLSPSQISALSEQNEEGVQKMLQEFLNFEELQTSVKEAILLDYYTAGFWWAKEMNFNLIQLSGFMDLLNFLLENLSDKHMTLGENLKELGRAMAGIGDTDSESGDLYFFSIEQAKAIIDYLTTRLCQCIEHNKLLNMKKKKEYASSSKDLASNVKAQEINLDWKFTKILFKHYKLYEYLFHSPDEEFEINDEDVNELAQPSVSYFPPLLEEDMPLDTDSSFMVSSTTSETESKGSDQEGDLEESHPEAVSFEADAGASVTAEGQKSTVDRIPKEVVGNLEAEINEKLQMQEAYTEN